MAKTGTWTLIQILVFILFKKFISEYSHKSIYIAFGPVLFNFYILINIDIYQIYYNLKLLLFQIFNIFEDMFFNFNTFIYPHTWQN